MRRDGLDCIQCGGGGRGRGCQCGQIYVAPKWPGPCGKASASLGWLQPGLGGGLAGGEAGCGSRRHIQEDPVL